MVLVSDRSCCLAIRAYGACCGFRSGRDVPGGDDAVVASSLVGIDSGEPVRIHFLGRTFDALDIVHYVVAAAIGYGALRWLEPSKEV